jgi:hypothetical protein
MPRTRTFLLLAGVLAAAGCRTFDDRAAVFPRLRDAIDPDDNRRQFDDRYAGRGPYTNVPYSHTPEAVAGSCLPCSGVGTTYPGGMTLGMPTVVGGGYAVPMTYSSGPVYPAGPVLGAPTYPNGEGIPVRPRRDDELPAPGGYSQPGAAEMGRSVAPKPPTGLPTGK